MKLTYAKDKLVAFHGIAQDKYGGQYVAGLLKTDPWASLLWCRDENQIRRRPGRRYEEYVAPSWSWASIDAPVLFYEAAGRQQRPAQPASLAVDPELHNIEVEPASSRETGAVKSGVIEMDALVVQARTVTLDPTLFNARENPHTYGRRNSLMSQRVKCLVWSSLILLARQVRTSFPAALSCKRQMLSCGRRMGQLDWA